METTIFLAQFWGWLLVILCLTFLLRRKVLVEELLRLIGDRGFTLVSGYLALIIGLATVILQQCLGRRLESRYHHLRLAFVA